MGINQPQVRGFGVGDVAHIPVSGGLILTARAAAGIVVHRGLTGIDGHRKAAADRHLLQILIEGVRHHAVHPLRAAAGHRRAVKPAGVGGLRQDQAGSHIAPGVPVDAAQAG